MIAITISVCSIGSLTGMHIGFFKDYIILDYIAFD